MDAPIYGKKVSPRNGKKWLALASGQLKATHQAPFNKQWGRY